MDSSSQTRNVSISLRVGDNEGGDNHLQVLGILLNIGHAPAAEMSNYLQARGLSESEVQNKPVIFLECESPGAAQDAASVLKDLPNKLPPNFPISKVMDKVQPDFRVDNNHLVIVCKDQLFGTELIEAMVEEAPEQALNSENKIEFSVRTAHGSSIGDIINNTLTNGGEISFTASSHKALPGSVLTFMEQNLGGGSGHIGEKITQAMTVFNNMHLNLGMKTLNEGVKSQLGPASPIIDALSHVGNLGQFVPPEVAEFKELKGVKGPLEIFFTSSGVIAAKITANLPGLGSMLFEGK